MLDLKLGWCSFWYVSYLTTAAVLLKVKYCKDSLQFNPFSFRLFNCFIFKLKNVKYQLDIRRNLRFLFFVPMSTTQDQFVRLFAQNVPRLQALPKLDVFPIESGTAIQWELVVFPRLSALQESRKQLVLLHLVNLPSAQEFLVQFVSRVFVEVAMLFFS